MKKILETKCSECDSSIVLPSDVVNGEIVGCPCCCLEYEVSLKEGDEFELKPAEIAGEDWGE